MFGFFLRALEMGMVWKGLQTLHENPDACHTAKNAIDGIWESAFPKQPSVFSTALGIGRDWFIIPMQAGASAIGNVIIIKHLFNAIWKPTEFSTQDMVLHAAVCLSSATAAYNIFENENKWLTLISSITGAVTTTFYLYNQRQPPPQTEGFFSKLFRRS